MIKISNNIKLSYERRKELIERSAIVLKLIEKNRPARSINGLEWKLSKAKSMYWKKYAEQLSTEELTILYLYTAFPSDTDLLNMITRYNYDFEKVAQMHGVSNTFLRLRYCNLLFMKINEPKEQMDNKTKNTKNNSYKTLKLTLNF